MPPDGPNQAGSIRVGALLKAASCCSAANIVVDGSGCFLRGSQALGAAAQSAPVVPPPRPRRPHTVYACPDCDTRYLGQQRRDDCGVFCRALGPGGLCPHCDEPVAVTDLHTPRRRPLTVQISAVDN